MTPPIHVGLAQHLIKRGLGARSLTHWCWYNPLNLLCDVCFTCVYCVTLFVGHTLLCWTIVSIIVVIFALPVFVVFTLLLLINLFILVCQKSKNHIKVVENQKFD